MLWLGIWIALIAAGGVKKEIIAYNGNIGICLRAFWLALAEFWTDKIDQFGERHSYWYAQELKCKFKSRKTHRLKILPYQRLIFDWQCAISREDPWTRIAAKDSSCDCARRRPRAIRAAGSSWSHSRASSRPVGLSVQAGGLGLEAFYRSAALLRRRLSLFRGNGVEGILGFAEVCEEKN
jgi:hypothetical protein